MKNFFLITLAFLVTVTGFAQERDAVILQLQKDYRLNDDGSITTRVRTMHRYDTHLGFDRLGEHFVTYNPRHQKLKIAEAYTVQKNGNVVKSPENAFNEVLPAFAVDAVAYNHLKEMVISFTGVELGAVSHLDYTLQSDAGYFPELDVIEALLQKFPVKKFVITVDVPEGKKLAHALIDVTASPEVNTRDGRTIYTWQFTGLSEAPTVTRQSGRAQPRLIFSTWKSQGDAMAWLAKKMQGTASETLEKKFKTSTGDNAASHKNFLTRYTDFLDTMGVSKVTAPYSGYTFRDTETILRSAYGTDAECALVLAQVMRDTAKIVTPVAVYPDWFDGQIGSLSAIETFAVGVEIHGKTICVSPVTFSKNNLTVTDPARNYCTVTAESRWLEKSKTSDAATVTATLKFFEKEITAVSEVTVRGALNPVLEIFKDVDAAKKLLTGKTTTAKLLGTSSPAAITAELVTAIPVKENGGYFFAELPRVTGGAATWDLSKLGVKRAVPLALAHPINERYHVTLEIPEGKRVVTPDISLSEKNEIGAVSIQKKTTDGKLEIRLHLEIKKSEIAPSEYADFLKLLHLWQNKNNWTLVVE